MTRWIALGWLAFWLLVGARPATASEIALSLRVAQARFSGPDAARQPRELGGMTRLLGAVADPDNQDLILVGEARPGEPPLSFDELAVMLRACVVADCAPLVSIDARPDSETTRLQTVRFEGGIAGTAVGQILLDADAALKMLALGKAADVPPGFRSYFDLIAETGDTNRSVASRFWFFVPDGSAAAKNDTTAALLDLPVGVRIQIAAVRGVAARPGDRDAAGERFVRGLDERPDLLAARPEVERLRTMMGLAVLAKEIGRFSPRPGLDFWISGFQSQAVATLGEFPLIVREEAVKGKAGVLNVRLEGGVDLRTVVREINNGSAEWFHRVVLASRPSITDLTWNVPLGQWPGVGSGVRLTEEGTRDLRSRMGTMMFSTITAGNERISAAQGLPSLPASRQDVLPTGGLADKLPANGVKITYDEMVRHAGAAEGAADVLHGRPAGNTLSWPATEKQGAAGVSREPPAGNPSGWPGTGK